MVKCIVISIDCPKQYSKLHLYHGCGTSIKPIQATLYNMMLSEFKIVCFYVTLFNVTAKHLAHQSIVYCIIMIKRLFV